MNRRHIEMNQNEQLGPAKRPNGVTIFGATIQIAWFNLRTRLKFGKFFSLKIIAYDFDGIKFATHD